MNSVKNESVDNSNFPLIIITYTLYHIVVERGVEGGGIKRFKIIHKK